jgi:hypothetical protein
MTAPPNRAASPAYAGAAGRLTAWQQFELRNLRASFAMEGMDFSDADLDVLAAYGLGELTYDEAPEQLYALRRS